MCKLLFLLRKAALQSHDNRLHSFSSALLCCVFRIINAEVPVLLSIRERSVNTTLPVVTINHLKPSTRYIFHVAACDNEGPGSEMAQVAVETTSEGDD
jgi:hypothetical protein